VEVFEYVKAQGFPNDADGNIGYSFGVQGWLPPELSPDADPDASGPLPVRKRPISLEEKCLALAAIHDVHWRGGPAVGPWSESLADRESNWYYAWIATARNLDAADAPVVRRWLEDVKREVARSKLKARKKPGPKASRTDSREDRKIYDKWKSSGERTVEAFTLKVLQQEMKDITEVRRAIERHRKRLSRMPRN
jgi:hypothetical protein